jgi:hypothetical protein
MSAQPLVVNSIETLQHALGQLRDNFIRHKFVRVTLKTGRHRSSKQNSHSHAWYSQLGRELPEDDERGWKRFCKLHFGVPILRAEEEDFREMYDEKIRPLPYETKLQLMEWVPITSSMTKAQLKKYEEHMQEHFAERGVVLDYQEQSA